MLIVMAGPFDLHRLAVDQQFRSADFGLAEADLLAERLNHAVAGLQFRAKHVEIRMFGIPFLRRFHRQIDIHFDSRPRRQFRRQRLRAAGDRLAVRVDQRETQRGVVQAAQSDSLTTAILPEIAASR